jgi:hypothetical protein
MAEDDTAGGRRPWTGSTSADRKSPENPLGRHNALWPAQLVGTLAIQLGRHALEGGGAKCINIAEYGAATLSNDTIESNSGANGGGIHIGDGAVVTLSNDTVEYNTANPINGFGGYGGGIYIQAGADPACDRGAENPERNCLPRTGAATAYPCRPTRGWPASSASK